MTRTTTTDSDKGGGTGQGWALRRTTRRTSRWRRKRKRWRRRRTTRMADGGEVEVKVVDEVEIVGEVDFEVFGKVISEVEVEH